jgi:tetratricopeptide (TPR) repeat protein
MWKQTMSQCDIARLTRAAVVVLATLGFLAHARDTHAQSADRVQLIRGAAAGSGTLTGEVVKVSPNAIELQSPQGQSVSIPIDQVRAVILADAPEPLRNAQAMILRDDAAGALAELGKLTPEDMAGVPRLVAMQLDFARAAAAGKLAAATEKGLPVAAAGLREFLAKHPQSHLVYAASEILASVLAKQNEFPAAAQSIANLAEGPAAYRVRAAAAQGSLLFQQKNWPEARAQYEAALKIDLAAEDRAGQQERFGAKFGRARCLAREGRGEEAVKAVRQSLAAIDPSDRDLLARGYAALGDAYRASPDGNQDAILAFLRVDLIYNSLPDAHAEALSNLADLWTQERNPERSRACQQALQTTYPDSGWTRRLAATE